MWHRQFTNLRNMIHSREYIFVAVSSVCTWCRSLSAISPFSNGAWFSLRGEVNCQNKRDRSTENPRDSQEQPVRDEKFPIWCAISAHRIIGPIFYEETIHAAKYANKILRTFLRPSRRRKPARYFPVRYWKISCVRSKFGSDALYFLCPCS
jgi:hypothetical protein